MSGERQREEVARVTIDNRQEAVAVDGAVLASWNSVGEGALRAIEREECAKSAVPERVGVIIVDDPTIAKLHGDYLQDPTPTDVMTFPIGHDGEIVISIETACRQAEEYGNSTGRELCLYIVHGLLHLCGFEDHSEDGRAEMAELQEALLEGVEREGRLSL